jgi:hypothetical protein
MDSLGLRDKLKKRQTSRVQALYVPRVGLPFDKNEKDRARDWVKETTGCGRFMQRDTKDFFIFEVFPFPSDHLARVVYAGGGRFLRTVVDVEPRPSPFKALYLEKLDQWGALQKEHAKLMEETLTQCKRIEALEKDLSSLEQGLLIVTDTK